MTSAAAATDEVLVGRYFLYREIAAGGMASIHLARLLGPVGFGRTVAVKRLHPHFARVAAFVAMFVDEARIVTSIRHPNVVPVLDVVAVPGHLLLVMEYVHGEPVSKLSAAAQARSEPIPPAVVSAIGIGLLEGLHAAHEARGHDGTRLEVIHRDVSPQNVLVGADGLVRVLDFGIAKAKSQLHETTAGSNAKGKLKYMAPEQVDGGPVDRRVDIWATGVILWELLTGQRLFAGDNDGVVVHRILQKEIEAPSAVAGSAPGAGAFDAILLRALARPAGDRWPDARAMALALEEACRPASTREMSTWVERLCGPGLREREAVVHELEAVASAGMPSVRTQLAFIADHTAGSPASQAGGPGPLPGPPSDRAASGRAAPDDATAVVGGRPVATRPSDTGATATPIILADEARPRRKRWPVAAGLVVMVAAGVFIATRSRDNGGSSVATPNVATSVTSATMTSPTATPPPSSSGVSPVPSVVPSAAPTAAASSSTRRPRTRPTDPEGVRLDHRK